MLRQTLGCLRSASLPGRRCLPVHGIMTTTAAQHTGTPTSPRAVKRARRASVEGKGKGASTQAEGHKGLGVDKGQAKRIKAKARDRQKALAKTGEEPIFYDICDLLGSDAVHQRLAQGAASEWQDRFPRGQEVTVVIERLSAHGDGLAVVEAHDWVIAVPHTLPGETVLARVYTNERLYSKADLMRVVQGAAEGSQAVQRRDDLVQCKYFGTCSGCQYQNIEYGAQLELKRTVVERAFRHFARGLQASEMPEVLPTLPSPRQYAYRTKLTPHFDLPKKLRKWRKEKGKQSDARPSDTLATLPSVPVGFDKMGEKTILDIEECSIATPAINDALPAERAKVKSNIASYKNGATLLLRDSLATWGEEQGGVAEEASTVVTDHKASVKEAVGRTQFQSPAGAFFQNNRSILPSLLHYVEEQVRAHALPSDKEAHESFLVDAYCGSGLFSLCLAHLFTRVAGVEISHDSIRYARENAALNRKHNVDFLAGDAMEIFKVSFASSLRIVLARLRATWPAPSTFPFPARKPLSSLIHHDEDAMPTSSSNCWPWARNSSFTYRVTFTHKHAMWGTLCAGRNKAVHTVPIRSSVSVARIFSHRRTMLRVSVY